MKTETLTGNLLECENVSLSFGSVRALQNVSLTLKQGEVTALVGDNGAGKSTLVRCMSGIHRADHGHITFDGETAYFRNPEEAREKGIETVHQNLALVEDLTVWQNLYLNRELTRGVGPLKFLNRKQMRLNADKMVSTLAVNVPAVKSKVRKLSGGQRQAIAICRAASFSSKLVIMDEPTAALGVQETAKVEELIIKLRDDGHTVLLISHNFGQVMRLADQVWVMRAGKCVAGRRVTETTGDEIVSLITGSREK